MLTVLEKFAGYNSLLTLFTIIDIGGSLARENSTNIYGTIYRQIEEEYIPAYPQGDSSQPIIVNCTVSLLQILELDAKNQVFKLNAYLFMQWVDEFLIWNQTEPAVNELQLPASKVWTPDIAVINSVGEMVLDSWKNHQQVLAIRTGPHTTYISWSIRGGFQVQCDLDIKWFPFDEQRCSLLFGTLLSDDAHIRLALRDEKKPIITDVVTKSNEFILLGFNASVNSIEYKDISGPKFPAIAFQFVIQRLPIYYIVNIVGPCILLSVLGLLSLCLPPECGEKISLQITVLLAFTVFQLLISDSVPQSATVPVIVIYISLCMLLTTLALISNAIILCMYHRDSRVPMSPATISFVTFCAYIVCMQCKANEKHSNIMSDRNHAGHAEIVTCIEGNDSSEHAPVEHVSGSEPSSLKDRQPMKRTSTRETNDNTQNGMNNTTVDWQRASSIIGRFLTILLVTMFLLMNLSLCHFTVAIVQEH